MLRSLLIALLLLPALAQAAIGLRGTAETCFSTNSIATSKTATCNKVSGTVDGDVMVAWVFASSNQTANAVTLTEPSGWTAVREHYVVQGTRTQAFGIYTKVASSEGSTYAFQAGETSGTAALAIVVAVNSFTGVDTSTPLDVTYSSGSHEITTDQDMLTSPNATPPSITTATANAWVLTLFGVNLDNILTLTAPSGYTMSGNTTPLSARNLGVAYIDAGAAGAESPGEWGYTESGPTTTRGVLATIALRPAGNLAALRRRR